MASTSRAFILSHVTDLSPNPQQQLTLQQPPHPSRHTVFTRRQSFVTMSCLSSGGGVSDDFVSTRKSTLDRGFSVIANMLKRVEPLDTSVISKGVSDYAKDSMKQTISTMLGLLPSDQFSVTVRVSMVPLYRLLLSSIITGYTLWNAEYRMSLTRNLDATTESCKSLNSLKVLRELGEESNSEGGTGGSDNSGEVDIQDFKISPRVLGDLSIEAFNYIQKLQSELSDAKEELRIQKQENAQIELGKRNRNDLLEYLRSLDSDMVEELSRPSSVEVEDIIQQLVRNTLKKFFDDESTSNFMGERAVGHSGNQQNGLDEFCKTVGTSRDYLAKLLFWCMLLGHHLRGLENRLHLSCVVGLL